MNQNGIDYLSMIPVDIFIKHITYLPFQDVVNVCSTNVKLRSFCSDPRYNNNWKMVINNTFKGSIYAYEDELKELWKNFNMQPNTYNYLVYTQLVNLLDPITQAMIYYRQGDIDTFEKLTKVQKFLSLFLLNKSYEMKNYLPKDKYLPFISILNGDKPDQDILNWMLIKMAKEGNMKGLRYFEKIGANIHARNDEALRYSSSNGHLSVVKYLISVGADVHALFDQALRWASSNGYLDVVKYLILVGADVHAEDDEAEIWASENGHLEVAEYLELAGY